MIVKVNDIKYYITNKNDCIQGHLINGIQWNNEILEYILGKIKEDNLKHFVNIGSHIGTVSLKVSKFIEKVSCIEAYPPTYKHLCCNIKLNNIQNISTYNVGVGNTKGNIYFMSEEMICPKENINRVKNNSGGMHSFTENDIKNNTRSSELCDKKIVGKSDLFNSMDIDHFDIMLVDIEGCEYNFLQGGKEKIEKNMPIIIIEIWDNEKRRNENMKETREEVIQFILSMNYEMIKQVDDDFIFSPLS
jgi:FkbM family methyltransferase